MNKEKQHKQKKPKHAAKGWDFKFRGGLNGINVFEIASTLSRKNPVAVVTILPHHKVEEGEEEKKNGLIVIDSSLVSRGNAITGPDLEGFLRNCKYDDYCSEASFDVIFLEDIADAAPILEKLSEYRQMELRDKREYTAAVNYPLI